jgi:hypothetical protein
MWSHRLSGLEPKERFSLLDGAFFVGDGDASELGDEAGDTIFLTNHSEAFDPIKGFAVREGGSFQFLLKALPGAPIETFHVPVEAVESAIKAFRSWLADERARRDA